MTTDDMRLVGEYARHHSEEAFATLVSRHVNLVYSVALHQLRDASLAEEVAQATFIILARKAGSLSPKTVLSAWLCRTAQYVAANAVRTEYRRKCREQETYMQSVMNQPEPESSPWPDIAPLLNIAMGELGDKYHCAIVLRFFEGKDFKQIGAELRVDERTAQTRVRRAVENMRRFFIKRGITLSAAVIVGAIATNSVQVAPAALANTVTAVALGNAATASGSTLTLIKGALKLMAWTKAKTAIGVGAGILLAVGAATTVVSQSQLHGKEMVGIGFSSYMKDERTGTMMILNVAPKSPAAQAGLPLHRVIIIRRINDIPVASKTIAEWKRVLDGPVGTKVRLELIIDPKSKETKTVELVSGKYPASDDQVILKAK